MDGSKTSNGVGILVSSVKLKISLSFRLPNQCSVFQAEIIAIKEALSWLKEKVIYTTSLRIFSDSQATPSNWIQSFTTLKRFRTVVHLSRKWRNSLKFTSYGCNINLERFTKGSKWF